MADFASAGQKSQQAALFCVQQMQNDISHVPPQQRPCPGSRQRAAAHNLPCADFGRQVHHLHRKGFALANNRRAASHECRHGLHIQRGGHDDQPQVGAQRSLTFKAEGKAGIGSERALMKFVKNHTGDIRQLGIILQHAREHALGDNLHAGALADAAFITHAVAYKTARFFTQQGRHIARQRAGRHAPWFKQQNAAILKPGLPHEPEGDAAAFARSRQGAEHQIAALGQRIQNFCA